MERIQIGLDGIPSRKEIKIGNKLEHFDKDIKFDLPEEFSDYLKYLIAVIKIKRESHTVVLRIKEDDTVSIPRSITQFSGDWSMYVMCREHSEIDLDAEDLNVAPVQNERVFISDAFIGIVDDNLIEDKLILEGGPDFTIDDWRTYVDEYINSKINDRINNKVDIGVFHDAIDLKVSLRTFNDTLEVTQAKFDAVNDSIEAIQNTQNRFELEKATKDEVAALDEKITGLIDEAPETLDTLRELASAIGDDPEFYKKIGELSETFEEELATKADKDSIITTEDLDDSGTAKISKLFKNGNAIHPFTSTDAVYTPDGIKLTEKLETIPMPTKLSDLQNDLFYKNQLVVTKSFIFAEDGNNTYKQFEYNIDNINEFSTTINNIVYKNEKNVYIEFIESESQFDYQPGVNIQVLYYVVYEDDVAIDTLIVRIATGYVPDEGSVIGKGIIGLVSTEDKDISQYIESFDVTTTLISKKTIPADLVEQSEDNITKSEVTALIDELQLTSAPYVEAVIKMKLDERLGEIENGSY